MASVAARALAVSRRLLRMACLLLPLAVLLAPRPAAAEPGDEITISVLTFGPGDHPFFKFGHNAILVHDTSRRGRATDLVYNYGTFGFDSAWLLVDFFKGKLRYWLSVAPLDWTISAYRHENRTIDVQELALTPAQRREVASFLEWNATPENRYYKYDYYQDNCSTRVRDVIDKAVGGRVAAASQAPAEFTWRQHTLRLTADDLPVFLGLDVAMGSFIDKPIRQWEEMFLPSKLEESLRRAKVPGEGGVDVPLVKSERVLLPAPGRAPLRTAPPGWKIRLFLAGAVIGALLAYLGWAARTARGPRVALGLSLSVLGLVLGFLGNLFLMFWFFTDHQVAYHNENILQCVPFTILLTGMGIGVARGKARSIARVRWICLAASALSTLGVLMKIVPLFQQQNGQILALVWPIWAGAAYGMHLLWQAAPSITLAPSAGALPPETAPPAV